MNFFSKISRTNKIIFIFLTIVVASFFVQTISKGLSNSCDLMWQPSKLFWDGINHYEYQMITGDVFLGCQHGRYWHFLFIFLYHITHVEWEKTKVIWIILNVFFVLIAFYFTI